MMKCCLQEQPLWLLVSLNQCGIKAGLHYLNTLRPELVPWSTWSSSQLGRIFFSFLSPRDHISLCGLQLFFDHLSLGIEVSNRNTSVKNIVSSFTNFTFRRQQKVDLQMSMCPVVFYCIQYSSIDVLISTYAQNAIVYIVKCIRYMKWPGRLVTFIMVNIY